MLRVSGLFFYRVDVVEQRRAVVPGLFGVAGQVGNFQRRAAVQSGQTVGQRHDAVKHQRRLGPNNVASIHTQSELDV